MATIAGFGILPTRTQGRTCMILARLAASGQSPPSDAVLARAARLRSRQAARARVEALIGAGLLTRDRRLTTIGRSVATWASQVEGQKPKRRRTTARGRIG